MEIIFRILQLCSFHNIKYQHYDINSKRSNVKKRALLNLYPFIVNDKYQVCYIIYDFVRALIVIMYGMKLSINLQVNSEQKCQSIQVSLITNKNKILISIMQPHKRICVFGSANADYFLYVKKIPAKGETIQSLRYMTANGGKGANQAVSVGQLAGSSTFIGQAGNDDAMIRLKKEMQKSHVDLKWKILETVPTGMAYIYVDEEGQNSIVIHGGANMQFSNLEDIDEDFKKVIDESQYLLLQKEIPMTLNIVAAKYAHSRGKIVILDCGGRDDPISEELLDNITYISPNETELERLDDTIKIQKNQPLESVVAEVRQKIIKKHPNLRILLKLGSKGSAIITPHVEVKGEVVTVINPQVLKDYKIIDTVGAGDCFTGAFAVRHSELDWSDPHNCAANYRNAMQFGNSAAFLCITKEGAMPSMPSRSEVDAFMQKYNIQ